MTDTVRVTVKVGWTYQRPVVPDQVISYITQDVECATMDDLPAAERKAGLLAFYWAYARPMCVMVTRVEIVALVL